MNGHRFGLVAVVTAVVLGANLLPAQAQEPGVALQRQLTESRILKGKSEDIVRGPQSDLSLDRFVNPELQSFIYPAGAPEQLETRTLVASPSSDTQITEIEDSMSVLREITSNREANSNR